MTKRANTPHDPGMSAQPCGCDAGAGHNCENHQFDSPESSNVVRAGYNPVAGECTVTFKSGWKYRAAISPTLWEEFKNAPSKGGFYQQHLKDHFVWTRL